MTIKLALSRKGILLAISEERDRQDNLKAQGKFRYSCADPEPTDAWRFTVLGEEVGEVARELNESSVFHCEHADPSDDTKLESELIQVAAVCVAWLERIQARKVGR